MPDLGKLLAASKHFFVCRKNIFPHIVQGAASPWWGYRARAANSTAAVVTARNKNTLSFLPWRHIWDMNGSFMTLQFCPLLVGSVLCSVQRRGRRRWTAEQGSHYGAAGCLDEMDKEMRVLEGAGPNVLSRAEQQLASLWGHPQG